MVPAEELIEVLFGVGCAQGASVLLLVVHKLTGVDGHLRCWHSDEDCHSAVVVGAGTTAADGR